MYCTVHSLHCSEAGDQDGVHARSSFADSYSSEDDLTDLFVATKKQRLSKQWARMMTDLDDLRK